MTQNSGETPSNSRFWAKRFAYLTRIQQLPQFIFKMQMLLSSLSSARSPCPSRGAAMRWSLRSPPTQSIQGLHAIIYLLSHNQKEVHKCCSSSSFSHCLLWFYLVKKFAWNIQMTHDTYVQTLQYFFTPFLLLLSEMMASITEAE